MAPGASQVPLLGEHALEHFRIGRSGQVIPQGECPANGVVETTLLEQQMGKSCFNAVLLGQATRMDVAWTQWFLKADPAGWEKNEAFFPSEINNSYLQMDHRADD